MPLPPQNPTPGGPILGLPTGYGGTPYPVGPISDRFIGPVQPYHQYLLTEPGGYPVYAQPYYNPAGGNNWTPSGPPGAPRPIVPMLMPHREPPPPGNSQPEPRPPRGAPEVFEARPECPDFQRLFVQTPEGSWVPREWQPRNFPTLQNRPHVPWNSLSSWTPTMSGNPIVVNGTPVIVNSTLNAFIIDGVIVPPPPGIQISNLNNDALLNILMQRYGPQNVSVRPSGIPPNFPPAEEIPPGTPGTIGRPLPPGSRPPSMVQRGITRVRGIGGGNWIVIGLQAWEAWRYVSTPCEEIRERYRITIMQKIRRANRRLNGEEAYRQFVAQLRDVLPNLNGGPTWLAETGGVFSTSTTPTIDDFRRYGFSCDDWNEIKTAEANAPSYLTPESGGVAIFKFEGAPIPFADLDTIIGPGTQAFLQGWQDRVNDNIERLRLQQCAGEELACVNGKLIEAIGSSPSALADLVENNCTVRQYLQNPVPNPESYVGGSSTPINVQELYRPVIDSMPVIDRERFDNALSQSCTPTTTCVGEEMDCLSYRVERMTDTQYFTCPTNGGPMVRIPIPTPSGPECVSAAGVGGSRPIINLGVNPDYLTNPTMAWFRLTPPAGVTRVVIAIYGDPYTVNQPIFSWSSSCSNVDFVRSFGSLSMDYAVMWNDLVTPGTEYKLGFYLTDQPCTMFIWYDSEAIDTLAPPPG